MKLKKLLALLSLAALLLSSCVSGEGTSTSPESPAATAEPAAAEAQESPAGLTVLPMEDPMAGIDDSLSFSVELDFDSPGYNQCMLENFKAAYAEKLSAYFEDIEIDDISCRGSILSGGLTGWFTFTAAPRPGFGIEPRELYCRSPNIYSGNEDRTLMEFERSYPMEPAEYLSQWPSYEELMADLDTMISASKEKKLRGLVEAELYVRQLDSRYILTAPAELEALALSLSGSDMYVGEPADISDYNPLYLRFQGGSIYLVPTAADGSNRCYVWDSWYAWMDGESIFQRFGVPLAAEGYEALPGGGTVTTIHSTYRQQDELTHTLEYSNGDAPVRFLFQQMMPTASGSRSTDILRLYEYDTQGRRTKEEHMEDGKLLTTIVYEYSGELLVRIEESSPTGGGYYETYTYDELGRLIEVNSYYPNAIGGPISSSGAFWYDDQGYRHGYAKDENGNLGSYENQPIRRPQD